MSKVYSLSVSLERISTRLLLPAIGAASTDQVGWCRNKTTLCRTTWSLCWTARQTKMICKHSKENKFIFVMLSMWCFKTFCYWVSHSKYTDKISHCLWYKIAHVIIYNINECYSKLVFYKYFYRYLLDLD